MRNILRFLGIIIISAVILFSIGSFYDLPLMKNIQLICWSFILDLFVFVYKQRQTTEVLTWYQVVKQFWLFIKCTILIPTFNCFYYNNRMFDEYIRGINLLLFTPYCCLLYNRNDFIIRSSYFS